MMDRKNFLKSLNSCVQFVRLDDLEIGKAYPITKFEKVVTARGDAICVNLENGDGSFKVFLPSRYNEKITDVDYMTSLGLKMKYNGKTFFNSGRSKHDIEFSE